MRKASTFSYGALAVVSVALAGCDVQKTEEGHVTVPKYEVQKTQEGSVSLPKYDVTAPDVQVSMKKEEVTVPKVTTEKETISVPDIDIKTGQEKAAEKKQAGQQ